MAIKKTTSTNLTLPLEGKTTAKKIAVKKAPAKKVAAPKKAAVKKAVTVKKTAAPKKAISVKKVASPKKLAKKETGKTIKKLPAKLTKGKTSTNGKVKSATAKSPVQQLVDAAVEGVLEVKGKNISVLDLKNIHNRVCDYYIICQADSSTQVNAIAGSVEEMVKKRIGERPYHTEGFQNSEWILVDYVTVVVHVFQSHIREFYNLEGLWADAEVTKIAFD